MTSINYDYFDILHPSIETYYQVISVKRLVTNNILCEHIIIEFDNKHVIEDEYKPHFHFIYKEGKLYINASGMNKFVVLQPKAINKEHLWNMLENIDDNLEVINHITTLISC